MPICQILGKFIAGQTVSERFCSSPMFLLSFNFQHSHFLICPYWYFFMKYTHRSMLNNCREFSYWSHIINCQIREKTFLPNCRQMLPFDCRQSFLGVATFSGVCYYSCRALSFVMHYSLEAPHGLLTTI